MGYDLWGLEIDAGQSKPLCPAVGGGEMDGFGKSESCTLASLRAERLRL